jgi:hypothetical protein
MCCTISLLILLGPRFAGAVWWFVRPLLWQTAFSSLIWPVLGLIFLPWATLTYVWVFAGGVTGFEWLLMALAVGVDLASYGGGAYGARRRRTAELKESYKIY